MNKEKLLKKFLENQGSLEEMKELFESIKQGDAEDFKQVMEAAWEGLDDFPELDQSKKDSINQNVLAKIKKDKNQGRVIQMPKNRNFSYAIAASLLLLISVGILWRMDVFSTQNQQNLSWIEITTQKGERKNITLPDGSKVVLNALTSLRYPEKFSPYLREVQMQGEAYFDIEHNAKKPFIVKSGKTTTTVLGTEFNVKATWQDTLVTVSLVQGKVEVFADTQLEQAQVLQPKQEWIYHTKTQEFKTQQFDVNQVTGWRNNHFVFDFEPLSKVIKQLEQHFGVQILLTSPALKKCQVKLDIQNASLEAVLKAISFTDNIKYEIKDSTITLLGSGCP